MKFICDNNLGKLVRHLRIAGFDTIENKSHNYNEILEKALKEDRVIITRDNKFINIIEKKDLNLKFIKLNSVKVEDQLKEVFKKFSIKVSIENMFTRCPFCNEFLVSCNKEDLREKVPEHTFSVQNEFWICLLCKRIYWAGSHWQRIINKFRKILK